MKNIPIPPRNSYLKKLIEKTENLIKRMRWKAFFFERNKEKDEDNNDDSETNNYGFRSRKCPPHNDELDNFESDLYDMIKNIEFRNQHDEFQDQLRQDIKKINSSTKAFIPADKTTNFYEVDKPTHDKLLMDNLTSTYKKASTNIIRNINNEAKNIATNLLIDDRAECMAERQAFITLKDHKDNFENKPTCRLINPAKSEIGRISKQILENINTTVRHKTGLNQWKNSASVINWYSDIPNKNRHTFAVFDIESFYPSITEKLLTDSINFAKQYTNIPDRDIDIIMHSRKSLLFNNDKAWIKKDNSSFDVTMGSYDGAEVCELVGLFILNDLCNIYGKENIGLYRDDGLAVFKNITGPQADRIRKDITRHFKTHGLNITIQTNLKIVNYLDVTFNLNNGTYYPYRKPNNQPLYINVKSNHPPNIIKQLPDSINRRISDISCNEDEFNKAKTTYDDALKSSGYTASLSYNKHRQATRPRRNRKRNIIWYNPPFSSNVKTNIGKVFLKLVSKHFPRQHKYHTLFNKNNIKVSYSCMENMGAIISKHNKKILSNNDNNDSNDKLCNCRSQRNCPLDNKCLTTSLIYNAQVTSTTSNQTTTKNYIGLTEGTFKQRYTQHKSTFTHRKLSNSTELSKYIWQLKDSNINFTTKWSIIARARPYNNSSKRCDLCLAEKLYIIKHSNNNLLNKRSELISKCRHENKFYLKNN